MSELCPRCQVNYYTSYDDVMGKGDPPYPALSRADNKTYICSACGTDEAMMQFAGATIQQPPNEWPVRVSYRLPDAPADGAHRLQSGLHDPA